jgi:hypothetical protein
MFEYFRVQNSGYLLHGCVFDGRAGALCVLVGVTVLFAPPILVTGSSLVVVNDIEIVPFRDPMLPDGDG